MGSNCSCAPPWASSIRDQRSMRAKVGAETLLLDLPAGFGVTSGLSEAPGRLGDPTLTLMTEPRMDKALLDFNKKDLLFGKYGPVREAIPCPVRPAGFGVTAGLSEAPGRLGDPTMTLMTEPRMDKALLDFNKKDLLFGKYGPVGEAIPCPVDDSSPLWMQYGWMNIVDKFLVPEMMKPFLKYYDNATMCPLDIQQMDYTIDGMGGNKIKIYCARPQGFSRLPAIIHLHGGGMALMSPDCPLYHMLRVNWAKRGFITFSVDFRNSAGKAGRNPYPAGLDDCMSGLAWVHENRDKFGISKIIISGESGGGNLSLSMAIRAKREDKLCQFDGVFASCPFIAGLTSWKNPASDSSLVECDGYFIDMVSFRVAAKVYDPGNAHENDPCAWPGKANRADLEGLPPHFLNVNELDPLRDEGINYASKLEDASVRVSCNLVKGTQHAGDLLTKHISGAEHLEEQFLSNMCSFAESL